MKTIPQDVLVVLDGARKEGNRVELTGTLDRKLYAAVNKVLEAAGGKWNRGAKAHIFPGDAADALEPLILTGEYATPKQDFGQFDTPQAIVARAIELARIKPGMRVLEPSAGIGNIAVAVIAAGAIVDTIEIDPKRAAGLAMLMTRIKSPLAGESMGIHGDFLNVPAGPSYDRVVMNPPFAKGADIAHVRHAYDFLNPGGRLVAIMSPGWTFRQDRKFSDFKAWADGLDCYVEPISDNAFRESGTNVSTIMVAIDKPL